MVKGLFAGLAGLGAAVAVFQLQGDGGAGPGSAPGAADAGAAAARDPGADAGSGGAPAAAARAPDAPLRFPRPRDGGSVYLGDTPGRVRADADADAGSADGGGQADAGAQADGGAQADELQGLRERVASLEQELARTRSDAQVQELDRLNQQVAALREQLAQEQARRQAEELAAQEARVREQEATAAIAAAQQQLAYGDYHALDTLDSISGPLPAPVQGAVESARAAVGNGDLAAARYWLSIALAEEQRRLLTH
ncbi:MAG TPA: hypothetical protein VF994_18140 [Myxococcales bacterium]